MSKQDDTSGQAANLKAPGGMSVQEWIDYWREGSDQWHDDGLLIETLRADLAWASKAIAELMGKSNPSQGQDDD